jgi:hypothetical protein
MISRIMREPALALVVGLMMAGGAMAQTSGAQATAPVLPSPVGASSAPVFKPILEPRALDILKATSARVAAAKSMSLQRS